MKYLKVPVIGLMLLLSTGVACAGGWSGFLTVKSVMTYGTHDYILVSTEGGALYDTANGCTVNSWSVTATDESRRARIYAGLLLAMSTGTPVQFWWNEGCGYSGTHSATVLKNSSE